MKNILIIVMLFVFIASFNRPETCNAQYGNGSFLWTCWTPNLNAISPFQFLDSLKINYGRYRTVTLIPDYEEMSREEGCVLCSKVPYDWIKSHDIDSLISLMDDTTQTIPVFSAYASMSQFDKPFTTVGIEAMRLIQGYKNKHYPSLWPEFYAQDTSSAQFKKTKTALIEWWTNNN